MILATYDKQPWEYKDYDIDYATWLYPMDDALDEVEDPPLIVCLTDASDTALVCDAVSITDSTCKLWFKGGTSGQRYKVTVRVTTVGGRKDESELVFKIKDD